MQTMAEPPDDVVYRRGWTIVRAPLAGPWAVVNAAARVIVLAPDLPDRDIDAFLDRYVEAHLAGEHVPNVRVQRQLNVIEGEPEATRRPSRRKPPKLRGLTGGAS